MSAESRPALDTHPVEVWYSPYRNENAQIILRSTKEQLQIAGQTVQDYWSSFLDNGIVDILMEAEMTAKPVFFKTRDENHLPISFIVSYKGYGVDRYTQPVDIFHFVESENNGSETLIDVATYRGQRQRYVQVVALREENGTVLLPDAKFRFIGKDLVFLGQISQAQVLFQTSRKPDVQQFLSVEISPYAQDPDNLLVVKAGCKGDQPTDLHLCRILTPEIVQTQKLRVNDPITGELQPFDLTSEGIVEESPPFCLPQAVANIANFQPATARN